MELPFKLKTLEPLPGALDILRFMGEIDAPTADADDICDALDMSNIRFGKAIRRLVTQGYMQMDGMSTYRLTENGREAAGILAQYDADNPDAGDDDDDAAAQTVNRRLMIALPGPLVAGQANTVVVGLEGAGAGTALGAPTDMVLRLSVVNGEPAKPQEAVVALADAPAQHAFRITPGAYEQVRLRVQVFQLGPNPDDISVAGGVYIDAAVSGSPVASQVIAYGGTIAVQRLE
jgi:hypothetical protein